MIKHAAREDFEAISRLIADQNSHPETHCIHSDTSKDPKKIQNEMIGLNDISELCFVVCAENEKLIGALGCELDETLGRGWVRGPFVAADTSMWESIADELLDGFLGELPSTIHRLDSFLNIANERGNAFFLARGFQQLRLVHVYVAEPFTNRAGLLVNCDSLKPLQSPDFISLHDTVFPQTYASGQKIVEKMDDNHQVFVYSQGNEIQGYVYAEVVDDIGDGSIEYIGVREDCRGKGVGRLLLSTALHWLFEGKEVPQVSLVVNDNLTNARSLYESVGFRLMYTGLHARKEW